jgi:hypothetical protein
MPGLWIFGPSARGHARGVLQFLAADGKGGRVVKRVKSGGAAEVSGRIFPGDRSVCHCTFKIYRNGESSCNSEGDCRGTFREIPFSLSLIKMPAKGSPCSLFVVLQSWPGEGLVVQTDLLSDRHGVKMLLTIMDYMMFSA